jgi:hypothetical protein
MLRLLLDPGRCSRISGRQETCFITLTPELELLARGLTSKRLTCPYHTHFVIDSSTLLQRSLSQILVPGSFVRWTQNLMFGVWVSYFTNLYSSLRRTTVLRISIFLRLKYLLTLGLFYSALGVVHLSLSCECRQVSRRPCYSCGMCKEGSTIVPVTSSGNASRQNSRA